MRTRISRTALRAASVVMVAVLAAACASDGEVEPLGAGTDTEDDTEANDNDVDAEPVEDDGPEVDEPQGPPAPDDGNISAEDAARLAELNWLPASEVNRTEVPWLNLESAILDEGIDIDLERVWDDALNRSVLSAEADDIRGSLVDIAAIWPGEDGQPTGVNHAMGYVVGGPGMTWFVRAVHTDDDGVQVARVWNFQVDPDTSTIVATRNPSFVELPVEGTTLREALDVMGGINDAADDPYGDYVQGLRDMTGANGEVVEDDGSVDDQE